MFVNVLTYKRLIEQSTKTDTLTDTD